MDKSRVDELLPRAYKAVGTYKIYENGKVNKTYRGQISAFGAAVSMGSLLSAVAFFSAEGGGDVDRPRLMMAIYELVTEKPLDPDDVNSKKALFKWVEEKPDIKEQIINAAIAIKLAINLYPIEKETQLCEMET